MNSLKHKSKNHQKKNVVYMRNSVQKNSTNDHNDQVEFSENAMWLVLPSPPLFLLMTGPANAQTCLHSSRPSPLIYVSCVHVFVCAMFFFTYFYHKHNAYLGKQLRTNRMKPPTINKPPPLYCSFSCWW